MFYQSYVFSVSLRWTSYSTKVQANPSVATSEISTMRPITWQTKLEFSGDVNSPAPMTLFLKSELTQLVTFRGKRFLLSGITDCSLGYKAEDTISNNLIVVETKKRWAMKTLYGQLLSYMGVLCSSNSNPKRLIIMLGMVHTSRKNNEKQNSIVYEVATDGFSYHFWRIDNDSNVSWNFIIISWRSC